MIKIKLLLFFALLAFATLAQEKPAVKSGMPDYYAKEEIINDGKRYRIHNCYLSGGPGFLQSTIRKGLQRSLAIDFQFPIKKLHFQAGAMMSGENFNSNNNIQGHIGYGYRREKRHNNIAAFIGPSFFTGVEGDASSLPTFYQGVGLYGCVQAVTKFTYDIGFGGEVFGEISQKQSIIGIRLIAFFSGAYRGPKRNFNPNVRAENSK